MLRSIFVVAATCFGIAVACLVAIMGGCAADVSEPVASESAPSAAQQETAATLHPGRIARLSTEVEVDAVWFDADAPHGQSGRLRLGAGAWLAPPEAFRLATSACGDGKERSHE